MNNSSLARQMEEGSLSHGTLLIGENEKEILEDLEEIMKYFLVKDENTAHKLKEDVLSDLYIIESLKGQIKIDEIREIQKFFTTSPLESDYKLCVIKNAQDLRVEAANALLKLLEEPPEYGVFVLTADSEQKVLPTICSRCRILHYYRRKEGKDIPEKEQFKKMMESVLQRDLLVLFDSQEYFEEQDIVFESIEYFLRDLLEHYLGGDQYYFPEFIDLYEKYGHLRPEIIRRFIQKTEEIQYHRKNHVNERLCMEELLLSIMEGLDD
ncbi:MAG: hypothetical protein Q4P28_01300 [Tissierellia bacterium]|nr:hypothetical protein [Tissierellia bacterium]